MADVQLGLPGPYRRTPPRSGLCATRVGWFTTASPNMTQLSDRLLTGDRPALMAGDKRRDQIRPAARLVLYTGSSVDLRADSGRRGGCYR